MQINSLHFLLFFVGFFFCYRFLSFKKVEIQNIILLAGSVFFYAFTDARMLFLVVVASVVYFQLGKLIKSAKKDSVSFAYLTLGVILGVGCLFYFKYFNFFCSSVADLLTMIGFKAHWDTLRILMPLGVSFWTFRLISYLIEIHRGKMEPEKSLICFMNYVMFFPCILSGPIDRPNTALPQIKEFRAFDANEFSYGAYRIILGLFKKMVIADRLAVYVENVYASPDSTGLVFAFAAVFYTLQMYCDFSGYSDMAIGVGRLMGIKVSENFNHPFFAVNIADYWRRWHMTLTSWLTDYLFMPLNVGLRNLKNVGLFISILTTMTLIGLWHGANWTFAVFGIYHGFLFLPLIIKGISGKKQKIKLNSLGMIPFKYVWRMGFTFLLVTIGLVIFRAANISEAFDTIWRIVSDTHLNIASLQAAILPFTEDNTCVAVFLTVAFFLFALFSREFMEFTKKETFLKKTDFAWQVFLIVSILLFSSDSSTQFIYFQF